MYSPPFEFPEIGGHEPALGERAIFRMVGSVHLDQGAYEIRPAGDLAHPLLDCHRRQRGRAVGVVKQFVLAAHGQDIRVPCDHPERGEFFRPRNAERIVGAKPAVTIMDAVVGIGSRSHERCRDFGWNIDTRARRRRHVHAYPAGYIW